MEKWHKVSGYTIPAIKLGIISSQMEAMHKIAGKEVTTLSQMEKWHKVSGYT
ncbi:hypothetical protein ERS070169_02157, partial [Streptococcus pneumoniae]